jgi:hypothetical protein
MKTYRDLQVWQKAITLVTEIYKISKGFPIGKKLCAFAPLNLSSYNNS